MPTSKIERFGKLLVQHVRDRTIRDCDRNCQPNNNRSAVAQRWQKAGVQRTPQVADVVIPDSVDAALFFLLNAVDQGLLRLQFVDEDGTVVDLTEEGRGELAGWYIGEGWRQEYSGERFSEW